MIDTNTIQKKAEEYANDHYFNYDYMTRIVAENSYIEGFEEALRQVQSEYSVNKNNN